jgi:hypothetical protein
MLEGAGVYHVDTSSTAFELPLQVVLYSHDPSPRGRDLHDMPLAMRELVFRTAIDAAMMSPNTSPFQGRRAQRGKLDATSAVHSAPASVLSTPPTSSLL